MSIYLGNLSIEQMEKRLGIKFPEELVSYMKENKQDDVSIPLIYGAWHCFDLPFVLKCADRETAELIFGYLKPFHAECKTALEFVI